MPLVMPQNKAFNPVRISLFPGLHISSFANWEHAMRAIIFIRGHGPLYADCIFDFC
jgi:hypothetical protein